MNTRKLRVGDKVRILDGSNIPCYAGGWTEDMNRHVGEIHEITAWNGVGFWLDNIMFTWDKRGLELVDDAKAIFNDPATIVLWGDGTKTVVKCQEGDAYDSEKGLALCYMKKYLGNTSRALNDALHKHLGDKPEGGNNN